MLFRSVELDVKDNVVLTSVDVMGRVRSFAVKRRELALTRLAVQFLEGLFQNVTHCKDFVKLDPVPIFLDIFALPCMPTLALHHPAFNATSGLFRIMIDGKSTEVVMSVLKQVNVYLRETKPLWSGRAKETRLAAMLEPCKSRLELALCGVLTLPCSQL